MVPRDESSVHSRQCAPPAWMAAADALGTTPLTAAFVRLSSLDSLPLIGRPSREVSPMTRSSFAAVFAAALFAALPVAADEADSPAPSAPPAVAAPAGLQPPKGLTGFRAADVDAELAREAKVTATLRPDSLRKHSRILTAEAHVAGTPADHANPEYVRQRFAAYGLDAQLVPLAVYL